MRIVRRSQQRLRRPLGTVTEDAAGPRDAIAVVAWPFRRAPTR